MPISYKHKIYIPTPDIQNTNMRTDHPVKSQISVNYNGANVAFDVLDYDKHNLVDADTTKTMCVCSHDIITYGTIPFCVPQLMYYTEGGLPVGNYKFTLDHAVYGGGTTYDGTYMFTLTQSIPQTVVSVIRISVVTRHPTLRVMSSVTTSPPTVLDLREQRLKRALR